MSSLTDLRGDQRENMWKTYKFGQHKYLRDRQHLGIEVIVEEIVQKYYTNRKLVSMSGL